METITTYTPYSEELIDDEFGCAHVVGEGTETTSFEDAIDEFVSDFMDDGMECGLIVRVNGKAHRKVYGDDFTIDGNGDYQTVDYDYEDATDLEIGFNPYMGCYDYDC